MTLLQRRVFLELMGNAVLALALLVVVLMLVASVEIVAKVDGLSALDFLATVPLSLAVFIDLMLPLSVLVSVVMTYGRLASDNELDALRASGVSPLTLLVPGLVFGLLGSLLLLLALDYGKPYAERAYRRAIRGTDLAQVLSRRLASAEPIALDERTILSIDEVGPDGQARNVRIQILDDEGKVLQEFVAERASIVADVERGLLVVNLPEYRQAAGSEAVRGRDLLIERPLGRSHVDLNIEQLTTPQLLAWLARDPGARGIFKERLVRIAVDTRLSGAASCVIFVLLGVPVALRFRRTDRMGAFLVAFVLALFVYYPAVRVGKALAVRDVLPSLAAAWTGNALLLLVGLLLTRRVLSR